MQNKVVTIGPLKFKARALSECGLKCRLSMTDTAGQKIIVTFFTSAQTALRKKRGFAAVKGLVKSSGKELILQEVK